MIKKYATILVTLTVCLSASAQRTSPDSYFGSAAFDANVGGAYGAGCHVDFGRYLLNGFWKAGLSFSSNQEHNEETLACDYYRYTADAEYMYRLVGTYSRNLNLYAGGGVFLGCNDISDVVGKMPEQENSSEDIAEQLFEYGLRAGLECEAFVSRNFAFVGGLRAVLPINGNYSTSAGEDVITTNGYHIVASIGVRYNF